MAKDRAVFFDRDGTLIREVGYLHRQEQIEVLPGVPEAIRMAHRHGFRAVMVTNQSAVARGFLTENELVQIHEEIQRRLRETKAYLDGIYYCPHHPTEGIELFRLTCSCRKPNPGMVERASLELGLDPSRSYVVGDQISDMVLAAQVGAKGILIKGSLLAPTGGGLDSGSPGSETIVSVEKDCWAAVQWIVCHLHPETS